VVSEVELYLLFCRIYHRTVCHPGSCIRNAGNSPQRRVVALPLPVEEVQGWGVVDHMEPVVVAVQVVMFESRRNNGKIEHYQKWFGRIIDRT